MASKPQKAWLSPEQESRARKAFAAGMKRDEVARLLGVKVSRLFERLKDQLADIRVGQGRGGGRPKKRSADRRPDPTPEEIAQRAAEVRATWTPEIEAERRLNFNGPLDDV